MKKGLIIFLLFVLFPIASADVSVSPQKVYPGQVMLITLDSSSVIPIKTVFAEIEHEKGVDRVELILKSGNIFNGIYEGTWKVHDTKNLQWYNITVTKSNWLGVKQEAITSYQDPTQSHLPEEIIGGTLGIGDYTFPGNVTVTGRVGIGTANPTEKLEIVGGDMKIGGSIKDSAGSTLFNGSTGKFTPSHLPY